MLLFRLVTVVVLPFGCGFAIGSARFCLDLVLVLVLVLVWFRFGGFECLVEFL